MPGMSLRGVKRRSNLNSSAAGRFSHGAALARLGPGEKLLVLERRGLQDPDALLDPVHNLKALRQVIVKRIVVRRSISKSF
jgi:hypothetical protein